jgi:thiamine kinase-like enzyme
MDETATFPGALFAILKADHGHTAVSAEPLVGGRNNALYRIRLADDTSLVAKRYFRDDRRRLEREYDTLCTVREWGFTDVPFPVARIDSLNIGVYSFVEGRKIAAAELSDDQLLAIAAHLAKLHGFSKTDASRSHPDAVMPAFSFADVYGLIDERMRPYLAADGAPLDARIARFLAETRVVPHIRDLLSDFRRRVGDRFHRRIDPEHICLSYGDFGAHNMLWGPDGDMVVLDLEYGGWDHPLRPIANTLAHEGMIDLPAHRKRFWADAYLRLTPLAAVVTDELEDYWELARIEWVMLLMTSLLPERIARFVHASPGTHQVDAYLEDQMRRIKLRLCDLP